MGLRCKSVVEIGCSTGKNTLLLSQIALEVHAIDFSAQMIEKAIKFREAKATDGDLNPINSRASQFEKTLLIH